MKKVTRSEQLMTRLTPPERKKVERLAKRLSMTPSSYLQFLVQRAR